MSIHDLIANAEAVDFLPISSEKERRVIAQKGKVTAAILDKRYHLYMTQAEFAHCIGVSPDTISEIENGEYDFTKDTLMDIHKKLEQAFEIVVLPGDLLESGFSVSSSTFWDYVFASLKSSFTQPKYEKIKNNFHEISSRGDLYAPIR